MQRHVIFGQPLVLPFGNVGIVSEDLKRSYVVCNRNLSLFDERKPYFVHESLSETKGERTYVRHEFCGNKGVSDNRQFLLV